MKITRTSINRVVVAVLEAGANKATVILDKSTKVTATRVKGHRSILVTMGKLNYAERRHIKRCQTRNISYKTIILK